MTVVLLVAGWVLAGVALALLVGGGVHIADQRQGRRPARLDPRAGQHAANASHALFTGALAVAVLVAVGVAQQTFGAA